MNAVQEIEALLRQRLVRLFALCGMLVWVAKTCVDYKYSVRDLDLWWHLKVGDWIVEHLAVPHTGLFSLTAADRPWIAYSWGYEAVLSRAYHWFGLMGVALLGTALTLANAYAVFWSLRKLSGRFWEAWFLAACTLYTFLFVLLPRPVFVSILFYVVMLTVLLVANRTGNMRQLYWLPLLFAIWANVHIQFVYALFVLGLFVATQILLPVLDSLGIRSASVQAASLPAKPLSLLLMACALATLIGPYGYHLYSVVLSYAKAQYSYQMIVELQPMSFRFGNHFVELLLVCGGFVAVGWQKRLDLFKVALLIFASIVGFRTARDCWFLAITAGALVADFPTPKPDQEETWIERGIIVLTLAFFLFLLSRNYGFNEGGLDHIVSRDFPVDASNYLRQNPLPGPLYNNLDWGGFLIWYMPQYPVAIDGRNDLYGDDLDRTFHKAQNALEYKNDPYLAKAGCVLLTKEYPLATVLKFDPRFVEVYEDPIAIIFARR
jgi:hypothetical protein